MLITVPWETRPISPTLLDINTLTQLPTAIRDDLKWIIQLIAESDPIHDVIMVWLFGSHARGDFIHARQVNPLGTVTTYDSDIDLLILYQKGEIGETNPYWQKLKKSLRHGITYPAMALT